MDKIIQTSDQIVLDRIFLIRGKRVMMDRDLAGLYGVETRILNQSVKRNSKRFPEDFMFQLTIQELHKWKSTSNTSNKIKMGLRKLPFVFTEHGVAMLSSVLNSETAIEVNIRIIRVFTRMREVLLTHKDILLRLERIERKTLRSDSKLKTHDKEMRLVFTALKELLTQKSAPMRKIGFRQGN